MTRRAVWQSDHRPGCPGGPLATETAGRYRALVCRMCGLAVEVSYPEMDPDAPAPEALVRWLVAQAQRQHPH